MYSCHCRTFFFTLTYSEIISTISFKIFFKVKILNVIKNPKKTGRRSLTKTSEKKLPSFMNNALDCTFRSRSHMLPAQVSHYEPRWPPRYWLFIYWHFLMYLHDHSSRCPRYPITYLIVCFTSNGLLIGKTANLYWGYLYVQLTKMQCDQVKWNFWYLVLVGLSGIQIFGRGK